MTSPGATTKAGDETREPQVDPITLRLDSEPLQMLVRRAFCESGYARSSWLNSSPMGILKVAGSKTGRRYKVHKGAASNVFEINEEGQPTTGWCFVPARPLAAGDGMLAQKIALETDELAALSIAHKFLPRIPCT